MQTSPGGSVSKRMVGQWPQLMGQGISQTLFTLDPCSMRPAHVHPRAAGLLYVVSGATSPFHASDYAFVGLVLGPLTINCMHCQTQHKPVIWITLPEHAACHELFMQNP